MAWGSFVKKLKGATDKVLGGIRKGVDFVKDKVIPGAKKVLDVVSPFIPYGEQINAGVDMFGNIVDKVDTGLERVEKINNFGKGGGMGLKEFVTQKVRI